MHFGSEQMTVVPRSFPVRARNKIIKLEVKNQISNINFSLILFYRNGAVWGMGPLINPDLSEHLKKTQLFLQKRTIIHWQEIQE